MARILLALVDPNNDFQQLLRADAEKAAAAEGATLDVAFTSHDLPAQLNRLRGAIMADPRPDAILVLAVRDKGLDRVAREAAKAGVSFVYLNRTEDELDAIRAESPKVAVCTVCADEIETGRIQGRIARQILPPGPGTVLIVQGSRRSLAARDRTAGMEEALKGSTLEVVTLEAGWTTDEAREAVGRWLGIVGRSNKRISLVGCNNDQIAVGALDALAAAAAELGRPDFKAVPVIGCDGTPALGQRLVLEGRLAGTVELARSAGPAVAIVARFVKGGALPPPITMLAGAPFVRAGAGAAGLPAASGPRPAR
jgi:ABC-type sugar transport system substrate-binding protein